ncbi:regulatory Fis family protein [Williamsia limnetica]|uniref:Regulatory Fis family protein n=1 Tax=Williamsia limnetica TaxID=882452 RepID=A0A318RF76_WILLI|nr:helix-turn-helix domain-containing protein [Williamsia limnetica]PYE12449.1 regulatory Fis family protein [Williamsia limnetica]
MALDERTRTLLQVRERFLSGDAEVHNGVVRGEIMQSWRRSMMYGLEPERSRPVHEKNAAPNEHLLTVAGPIIEARRATLVDSFSSLTITDSEGQVLQRCVEDSRLTRRLDQHDVLPGFSFAETSVGTNSGGMVLETGRASMVAGPEHFFEQSLQLTCAGAPITHPVSKRIIGTLNLTCRYEDTSPIMLSWVREVAAAIERELAVVATRREHLLFNAFLSDNRDSRHPVICLDQHTVISNAAASRIVSTADQPILWEHAARAMAVNTTTEVRSLTLSDGSFVDVHVTPVSDGPELVGALMRVKPVSDSAAPLPTFRKSVLPGLVGNSSAWQRLCDKATAVTELSTLAVGEAGTGKFAVLTSMLGTSASVIDARAYRSDQSQEWLSAVHSASCDGESPVILRHLELIDDDVQRTVASSLAVARDRGVPVAATMTTDEAGNAAIPLVEWFDCVLEVPPLAERFDDLPLLLDTFSARYSDSDRKVHWMSDAVQTLSRLDWDRNVASIETLVRTLLRTGHRDYIGAQDLPSDYRVRASRRRLAGLEQVEARAIINALRETRGNKRLAADKLGIARSTLYRKVRALGIDLSSTNF